MAKPKSKMQVLKLGCFVCTVAVSGLAIGYGARQIEDHGLSQFVASLDEQTQKIHVEQATEPDITVAELDEIDTTPPPPDMGAIFAQQKAEEEISQTMYEPAQLDRMTTGSIAPYAKDKSYVAKDAVEASLIQLAALSLKNLPIPIPVPSPKKDIITAKLTPIEKPRLARKGTPDILIIGDSQISVSAGPSYQKFFSNIPSICNANQSRVSSTNNIDFAKTASLGVRSTSLHSWVARSGAAKGSICDVDKKWGVNAGVWGISGNPKRKYVQIGKGKDYKFCKPKASAFESMFAKGYYNPKLLVMAFLGNSADRWARSKKNALRDVKATLAQIPDDTACIFMTSAPVYSKRVNDVRVKAQKNITSAFKETGNRCTVVQGLSPKIRAEVEGNKAYFRKTKSGKIADKFHPNAGAIKKFVKYNTPALCRAIREQLG